jgi:hypothetical protein
MTIGRWRRHRSPFAANSPSNPISRATSPMRDVRWKPSGRSRRTLAIVSASVIAKNSRRPRLKRKHGP